MIRPSGNSLGSLGYSPASAASKWSMPALRAEIAQTSGDLNATRVLEEAARARHARENTPETEAAYKGRRDETARVRGRYVRLLDELNRRNGAE